MKSPALIAALVWIGTYLVAGAIFSLLEVAWSMNQAMSVENLEALGSSTTEASLLAFAIAPILVASWFARRVYRARQSAISGEDGE